jgi:ATP-dependent RNA helicase RhlE
LSKEVFCLSFAEFEISSPILQTVRAAGYDRPTPIQTQAIPRVLAGHDVIGCAQTGTGKTVAFVLPILQRLWNEARDSRTRGPVRSLVLAPTRELALQIGECFARHDRHLGLGQVTLFGGVNQAGQVRKLQQRPAIVVATPGRLLDLVSQGYISLDHVSIFVLDEADRMFDMGFIHDVRRIVSLVPRARQTLLFSATMEPRVRQLAANILTNPVSVQVTPTTRTADRIEETVYLVDQKAKRPLLIDVLDAPAVVRALVFSRTKHGANRIERDLTRSGISAVAMHGNKSQSARERALAQFRCGDARVLVATDIAARGIDVQEISHVINFDMPSVPEDYVHRIGRTARAGAAGTAYSFCDVSEYDLLAQIERLLQRPIRKVNRVPAATGGPESRSKVISPTRPQPSRHGGRPMSPAKAAPTGHPQRSPMAKRRRSTRGPSSSDTGYYGIRSRQAVC